MKKMITEEVLGETKFYCDKHPDRECFSELKTASWYGSEFDLMGIELHLCDVCMLDFYKQIQKDFGIDPKNIEI